MTHRWAWQNAHQTRHIAADDRSAAQERKIRVSPKPGRRRKRVQTSKLSLSDRLFNLRTLLNSQSFAHWPLHVRFFAADVHKAWQKLAALPEAITRPLKTEVILDDIATMRDADIVDGPQIARGIHALAVTYIKDKSALEQSMNVLTDPYLSCHACKNSVAPDTELLLVCPKTFCQAVFHMHCLSKALMPSAASTTILPTNGQCPCCKARLVWTDLVRQLSLRARGDKEVAALFKVRSRKKKDGPANDVSGSSAEDTCEEELLSQCDEAESDEVLGLDESDREFDGDEVKRSQHHVVDQFNLCD